NNVGFTGSGFANTANATGQGVEWKIGGSAGNYTFNWRYASTSNRPGNLIVNGSVVASNIAFNSTGIWTSWTTVSTTVNLPLGVKTVRLEATTSSGLGNIDYMEVTGPDAVELSCASSGKMAGGKEVLSIEQNLENTKVSIYPNPSSSKIAVVLPISKFNNYVIYDISGRATMSGQLKDNLDKLDIDINHLSKGIYIISLKGNQTTETHKFIKK
uniref:T9SS type A sorting domain-containing protein n=1 Tax=Mariniflexile sp. TaxID=1979402 RepID=UPI003563C30E